MVITAESFGQISDGRDTMLFTLTNSKGTQVKICNYGCRLQSFIVADKTGKKRDIALGYDNAMSYEQDNMCMGGIIGRHANRIKNAEVILDGKLIELEKNNGIHHIHGGEKAFHYQVWEESIENDGITFTHVSPSGTAGFPGNLTAKVTFSLSDDDELIIDYDCVSDQTTVCNLTCHGYFNLNGYDAKTAMDVMLQVFADEFTESDGESLPTGRFINVGGTPMDFRTPHLIGVRIEENYQQLQWGKGYDHNYVLNRQCDNKLRKAAYAVADESGIAMTVYTTLPGMQLYTGNYLDGSITGKQGVRFNKRTGFCLETQYFPNAFANPEFPQPIIKAGEHYTARTIYHVKTAPIE